MTEWISFGVVVVATLLAIIEEVLDLRDRRPERSKVKIAAQCVVVLGLGVAAYERYSDAHRNREAGAVVAQKLEDLSTQYPEGDDLLRKEIREVAEQIRESDTIPGPLMYSVYLRLQDAALRLEGLAQDVPGKLKTIEDLARSSDTHAAAGNQQAGKAYEEARRATNAAGQAQFQARTATNEAIAAKNAAGEAKSEATAAKAAAVGAMSEATAAKNAAVESRNESTQAKNEATAAKNAAGEAKAEATHAKSEATAARGLAGEAKAEATRAKSEATAAKDAAIESKNEAARVRSEARVTRDDSTNKSPGPQDASPDAPDAGGTDGPVSLNK